jgi:hypothetical protein
MAFTNSYARGLSCEASQKQEGWEVRECTMASVQQGSSGQGCGGACSHVAADAEHRDGGPRKRERADGPDVVDEPAGGCRAVFGSSTLAVGSWLHGLHLQVLPA